MQTRDCAKNMKKKLILICSPHPNSCGETYVLPNIAKYNFKNIDSNVDIKLLNLNGEFHFLSSNITVNNPLNLNIKLNFLKFINSWLHYRVWLTIISLKLIMVLPFIILKHKKKYHEVNVIARMASTAVSLQSFFFLFNKKINFYLWIAGQPQPSFFRKIFWPLLFRRYKTVFIPTEQMRKSIFKLINHPNIKLLRNAVINDELKYYDKFVSNYRQGDILKIVAIGRLSRQKGFDTLIKSLNNIEKVKCDIIGSGEDHQMLQNLIRINNLGERVNLLGWIENPWKQLKNYDLFVMPSRWEGPGHTIIEAMAIGIPSIVSDCPSGPLDSIAYGKYGFYFKVDDIENLKKEILFVKNNYPLALSKANNGIDYIIKNFDINACHENLKKFFT